MRTTVLSMVLLLPLSASAASPSFDCAKTTDAAETLICKDDDLAKLDRALADVYAKAFRNMSDDDKAAEKKAEGAWIKERDACARVEEAKACLKGVYEARLTDLQVKSGSVQVPAPTFYDCGKVGIVSVYFYNDTQRPAAVVNLGVDVQDLALSQPTGSGVQYAGKRLTFWTKGDAAILIRKGKPDVTCTQQASAPIPD